MAVRETSLANGRYHLRRMLGTGGTSSVYAAADRVLGRDVAVKVLDPSLSTAVLADEARSVAGLNHPNIVALYDIVAGKDETYLVMEYVDGCDLEQWVAAHGRLSLAHALEITCRVGAAVSAAHDRGILHCDVKPSNVLVSSAGDIKLADFTLSRHETDGGFIGPMGATMDSAAPEQIAGNELSPQTDVFGLGRLLERIIDHRRLVGRRGKQVLRVIDRATRAEPAERYETVEAFLSALPRCTADTVLVAQSTRPAPTRVVPILVPESPGSALKKWLLLFAAAILVLGVLAVVTWRPVPPAHAGVTVPDVVGTDGRSGEIVIRSLGLHPHLVRAYSGSVPEGLVSAQEPHPGGAVPSRSTITIVISRGPRPVEIPAVTGLSQDSARAQLRARGFRVHIVYSDSISTSPGTVMAQSIQHGTLRVPGTRVEVTVSQKPWWWIF